MPRTPSRATIARRGRVGLLVALDGETVQAALLPDVLEEGIGQPRERPPGMRVVRLENDEARGFGDGRLHVDHQAEKKTG